MNLDTTLTRPSSTPVAPGTLTALVTDGLASDAAMAALGSRLMAVRIVLLAEDPKRCCSGHQPLFLAVDPGDPTLPERERQVLDALATGHAVPGSALAALAGGVVALPGLSLAIDVPRDLGPGLEEGVVLTLADAARGLAAAGPAYGMRPGTVAIVSGDDEPPEPWRSTASGADRRMPLAAGLADLTPGRVAA